MNGDVGGGGGGRAYQRGDGEGKGELSRAKKESEFRLVLHFPAVGPTLSSPSSFRFIFIILAMMNSPSHWPPLQSHFALPRQVISTTELNGSLFSNPGDPFQSDPFAEQQTASTGKKAFVS